MEEKTRELQSSVSSAFYRSEARLESLFHCAVCSSDGDTLILEATDCLSSINAPSVFQVRMPLVGFALALALAQCAELPLDRPEGLVGGLIRPEQFFPRHHS